MKKLLLTGGSGFVGTAVVESLLNESEFEIHALCRSVQENSGDVIFYQCDLLDYQKVNRIINHIKPDFLIHLAWNVDHSTYLQSSENLLWIGASLNILKTFAENGGKRVFMCGTCFEQVDPLSLYAASKLNLYQIAQKYCETVNISFVWGRLFYLFGEGEGITRVVPYAISELLKGNIVTCKNATAVRDFMYINDAGIAIVKTLLSNLEGSVNIASGKSITMGELFSKIGEILGENHNVILENHPAHPQNVVADVKQLEEIVGFHEHTDLRKALEKTIQWWKENI